MKENVTMQVGTRQLGSRIIVGIILVWCTHNTESLVADDPAGQDARSSNVRIACFNVESLTVPGEWGVSPDIVFTGKDAAPRGCCVSRRGRKSRYPCPVRGVFS